MYVLLNLGKAVFRYVTAGTTTSIMLLSHPRATRHIAPLYGYKSRRGQCLRPSEVRYAMYQGPSITKHMALVGHVPTPHVPTTLQVTHD